MPIIAVDVMGGDFAPEEIIKGIIEASHQYDARYILVGNRNSFEAILDRMPANAAKTKISEIIHTEALIAMDEEPSKALAQKPDASIAVAAELVAQNKADALVSAGNTGAVILASVKHIPLIPGIERSGFATYYPTASFNPPHAGHLLLLDVGATLHCEAKHLVHFAVMGYLYTKYISGVENPRIGLLNIGVEPEKGGETLTTAYKILKQLNDLNFIGNVEGFDLIKGAADVVVCEGRLGNIVIKLSEGVADTIFQLETYAYKKNLLYKFALFLMLPGLKKLKKSFDYTEYGGAPLLGFTKPIIKAHGRSKSYAIKNAIGLAIRSVDIKIQDKIAEMIGSVNSQAL